jgi:hypothetical protein
MKKVLLFTVIVGSLAFMSCSKSECECTSNGLTTKYSKDDYKGSGDWKDDCKETEGCKVV